jgi:hypothetical protein
MTKRILAVIGLGWVLAACGADLDTQPTEEGQSSESVTDSTRTCGGLLGLRCAATEYCNFTPDTCGVADQTGVCAARPEACPQVFDPVIGCDGKKYSNRCVAAANGTDVIGKAKPPL